MAHIFGYFSGKCFNHGYGQCNEAIKSSLKNKTKKYNTSKSFNLNNPGNCPGSSYFSVYQPRNYNLIHYDYQPFYYNIIESGVSVEYYVLFDGELYNFENLSYNLLSFYSKNDHYILFNIFKELKYSF